MKYRSLFFLLLVSGLATGCQSTGMLTKMPALKMPWSKTAETEKDEAKEETETSKFGTPSKMVCVWKDGTLDSEGKRIRGLAGRVYFQDAKENPVKVDGTFAVYAYANDGILGPSKTQPERKFVFERENLEQHFSESEIGASYSFWLPWDEIGGEEAGLAILPVLKTADGRIIRGEESSAILPGRKRNNIESSIKELREELEQKNRQVIYESSDYKSHVQRQQLMRTDTIRVPADADAVLEALQQQQAMAQSIPATIQEDKSRVVTADASMNQVTEAASLPKTSDEAWEQALHSFRSRGAATNQRLDPRNIKRY